MPDAHDDQVVDEKMAPDDPLTDDIYGPPPADPVGVPDEADGTNTLDLMNAPVEDVIGAIAPDPATITADRYIVFRKKKAIAEVMWDGVTPFDPGDGLKLVRAADIETPPVIEPEDDERPDEKARRTRAERLSALLAQIIDDRDRFDEMNAAQRQAAQRRALRATIVLCREVLHDQSTDE